MLRKLGRSDLEVSAVGLGCWAIGGPFFLDGKPDGWGDVDDNQSIRAIELALDLGARLFDTADAYGTGHSESVIGRALGKRREDVVIATKFGFTYDQETKALITTDVQPSYIREACAASLRRLNTDYIDLYQIHVGELTDSEADRAGEELEKLCREGAIRYWGWSTDNARAAARMLDFPHFTAVQQELSVFNDGPDMLALCEAENLASLNRSPLAMGMLTGKFSSSTVLPSTDVRAAGHSWVRHFEDGRPKPEVLARVEAIRELLQTGGRTLAQGALSWNLARSAKTVPIPGFKTEAQVRDNLGAMAKGPLPQSVMAEIDKVLALETETV
ncbi:aldo/keto reductase [Pelagibacterium xiamenense]|uniref:aldo/keto reductase n=1 Tax=Pelagibacterium xiamenense TaxID=2901140 RepID=UPI001E65A748|nr:aldo/keto reductase [Pelagibacterium xiamenense]MCD7059605.1 aldo/keto reductase [Pelagibacterium xiamenense]